VLIGGAVRAVVDALARWRDVNHRRPGRCSTSWKRVVDLPRHEICARRTDRMPTWASSNRRRMVKALPEKPRPCLLGPCEEIRELAELSYDPVSIAVTGSRRRGRDNGRVYHVHRRTAGSSYLFVAAMVAPSLTRTKHGADRLCAPRKPVSLERIHATSRKRPGCVSSIRDGSIAC